MILLHYWETVLIKFIEFFNDFGIYLHKTKKCDVCFLLCCMLSHLNAEKQNFYLKAANFAKCLGFAHFLCFQIISPREIFVSKCLEHICVL